MSEPIITRDKFLTQETSGLMQSLTSKWKYGALSKSATQCVTTPHWRVTVVDSLEMVDQSDKLWPEIAVIWKKITDEYGYHLLRRCYFNGYDHDDDGAIHLDSDLPNAVTFLTYIMDSYWNPDWGGETLVYDPARQKVIAGCLPQQGRLLKFPGCWPHRGSAPTKMCPNLRVILVFKSFSVA